MMDRRAYTHTHREREREKERERERKRERERERKADHSDIKRCVVIMRKRSLDFEI
jgi:hypothetical protein